MKEVSLMPIFGIFECAVRSVDREEQSLQDDIIMHNIISSMIVIVVIATHSSSLLSLLNPQQARKISATFGSDFECYDMPSVAISHWGGGHRRIYGEDAKRSTLLIAVLFVHMAEEVGLRARRFKRGLEIPGASPRSLDASV